MSPQSTWDSASSSLAMGDSPAGLAGPATFPLPNVYPALDPVADPTPSGEDTFGRNGKEYRKDAPALSGGKLVPRPKRSGRYVNGFDWATIIWTVVLHAGALEAPFYFTWQALLVALVMHWATGSLGICLGYHRLLTHGSFMTYRPVRWIFAWLGGLAGEGSAVTWVATHRKHHVHSDQEDDPHSPNDGKWWSHMFWLVPNLGKKGHAELTQRWAPDLVKDRGILFLHRSFLAWHILLGFAFYGLGYWMGGTPMAVSMVLWAMFLRLVCVLHVTWFVNSASHIWGYRNYETADNSRNLWWVGLFAYGEGWHNNHHAFQRMAKHGHKWWEIDMTYWAICALEKVGLAWHVVHDVPARQAGNE